MANPQPQQNGQLTHAPTRGAEPKRKPLDWDGELDVTCLTLPHMMAMTGGHGIIVGGHFAGGGNLNGLVRRITVMPNGSIRVIVEKGANNYAEKSGNYGAFIFFGNGMYAEIDSEVHENVTEQNSGPWQTPVQQSWR